MHIKQLIRPLVFTCLLSASQALYAERPPNFIFILSDNIAELAKTAGYATATFGKWGMGFFDSTGAPQKQGVDHFFGYKQESGYDLSSLPEDEFDRLTRRFSRSFL